MLKYKFRGTIKGGKLVIIDRVAFDQHVAGFPEGAEVGITIARRYKSRSDNQNAYYWGVVLKIISDHTGHSSEELHEIFKRKFLPPRVISYRDSLIKIPASTTETDTIEFTDYIERVRAEAASMGIDIPNPDQVHL